MKYKIIISKITEEEVPEELKEPTREELAALGKMDSDTSTEEDA